MSCPALCRASTPLRARRPTRMAGTSPAMTRRGQRQKLKRHMRSPCGERGELKQATARQMKRGRTMFGDYSLGDLGAIFAMQGYAGLILFSVYLLMALGLAVIFGQMGVINMARGGGRGRGAGGT